MTAKGRKTRLKSRLAARIIHDWVGGYYHMLESYSSIVLEPAEDFIMGGPSVRYGDQKAGICRVSSFGESKALA